MARTWSALHPHNIVRSSVRVFDNGQCCCPDEGACFLDVARRSNVESGLSCFLPWLEILRGEPVAEQIGLSCALHSHLKGLMVKLLSWRQVRVHLRVNKCSSHELLEAPTSSTQTSRSSTSHSVSSMISCTKSGDCLMPIGRWLHLNCPKGVTVPQRSFFDLTCHRELERAALHEQDMSTFVENLHPFCRQSTSTMQGSGCILRLMLQCAHLSWIAESPAWCQGRGSSAGPVRTMRGNLGMIFTIGTSRPGSRRCNVEAKQIQSDGPK